VRRSAASESPPAPGQQLIGVQLLACTSALY